MSFKYTDRFKMLLLLGIFNMFNIIDKVLTWIALKNPLSSELNPITRYSIGAIGITVSMVLYIIIVCVVSYITYKIMDKRRIVLEKYNMVPEKFFVWLNIGFCLIVINNLYWLSIA
jgi:hypothetical protein